MSSGSESLASVPPPSDEPLIGRVIGKYEIVRVIGRGGMGTVYEAVNVSLGKRVAMKFVDAELARNKDAVARFQREAQAASAVESAHIVQMFDSGTSDDGLPYIVMELLRGEDLGHRIKRCGRIDLPEALHVVAQILRGLYRAHQGGIVHRDLKPDNIFLVDRDDDQNFAKILDFGVSKVQPRGDAPARTLTREGTVLGTPFYMSPEQAQALPDIDGRADLWSVGAILFECLTGRPPHSGGSYEQVIVSICMKDVDDVRMHNPGVPEAVAEVVAKALTRDRDARFATSRDMLDALVSASGGMLSVRSGRASGDDIASGPGGAMSTPPGLSARTPRAATPNEHDPAGFAPTLDARAEGPSNSKVGWSTSGDGTKKRDLRVYGVVAVLLTIASVGAVMLTRPPRDAEATAQAAVATPDVEVQLASNVSGARFLVDGKPLEGGVLKGPRGDVTTVRVEAEGYDPIEQEVTIDPTVNPLTIQLAAPAPEVHPGPVAAEPTASASVAPPPKLAPPVPRPGTAAPIVAAPTKPTAAPTAAPTGVAGGLQLKEE